MGRRAPGPEHPPPGGHQAGSYRGGRGRRTPPPSGGPIPPYAGDVVGLQNEITSPVEEASQVVGGQNNPLRIVYGRTIIGADIDGVTKLDADLVVLCVWCEGEIDAIERIWINGADPGGYVKVTHYTGAVGQGVDPTIKNCYSAIGKVYADTLPGIAYSVVEVPPGQCAGFPQVTALIRGKKVSTSSGGAKTYSDNPAYCIADFIENATYGMGRSVDWSSVNEAAAHCDEMIGSPAEKRNIFSLVVDTPQPVENWLAVMRDYASCWVIPEGVGYRLVVDSTGTVGATKNILDITQAFPARVQATAHGFADNAILKVSGITTGMVEANGAVAVARVVNADHIDLAGINSTDWTAYASGGTITQIGVSAFSFNAGNMVVGTWNGQKAGTTESPTVVDVDYTNTAVYPWRTDTTDPVFVPGVYDIVPTVPFRRTSVQKPGLTRYSEAVRYAIQMLNVSQLDDLSCQFQAFDIALQLQVGDLVDVTHHSGIVSKIMRLARAEPTSPGRWDILATEHDDVKYSTSVISGPAPGDSPLDSPLHPPTVTGLVVSQATNQNSAGAWISQIVVVWNDAGPPAGTYPFVQYYRVDIFDGATLRETATVQRSLTATQPRYVSGGLPENVLYTVKVTTLSSLLVESVAAEASLMLDIRSAKPSDVVSITAFEVGGEVRISIVPAEDFDLTAHEYRYGDPGTATWETATLLDRVAVPSIRYTTKAVPAGTWRIFVKGLDSVRTPAYPWGQESVNAIHTDVTVTADTGAFLASEYDFVSTGTLTSVAAFRDGAGNRYWVTDNAASWNSTFTGAMSGYTNAVYTYFQPGSPAAFSTDHHDFGALVTGTWSGSNVINVLAGSVISYLSLSNTDSSYTNYDPMLIQATGQWGRIAVIGIGTFVVRSLGTMRVVVIGRTEHGAVTTSATVAATVTLANRYAKAISIQLTAASGATPRFPTYDNVVVGTGVTNTFDAYAFDAAGAKQVTDCTYVFTGI